MTLKKRNASLSRLVHDASDALADYARWPETQVRIEAVDSELAILHEALHGHDPAVPHGIMLTMFARLLEDVYLREIPRNGLRLAIVKLANLVEPPDEKNAEPKPTTSRTTAL